MNAPTLTFTAGIAINRDMFYIACVPDNLKETDFEAYSRMCFYQGQMPEKWFFHDLPNWRVQSMCFPEPPAGQVRVVYSLSEEGEIEAYSRNGAAIERIPGAGLTDGRASLGYVTAIRHIGGKFYVCGHRGQIYRRDEMGWAHADDGVLQHPKPINQPFTLEQAMEMANVVSLNDINGFGERDLYVVGGDGYAAHFDGKKWTQLDVQVDECLTSIHCDASGVLVVGWNGTFLQGNAKNGFKDLSSITDNNYLYSVTRFNGVPYIGANDGLYTFDGAMRLVPESRDFELTEVIHVEAKDGVLWALASKDLVRFDGHKWERFQHPECA